MKHLLILLFLLCFVSVSAQDVIVKQDGSTIVCRIVDLTSSEITYKKWNDLNGSNYVMNRTDASAINYENGKKVNLSEVDNLYKPGNQNDGVQNYNDRALLEIDANEHPKKKLHIDAKWNIKAGLALDNLSLGCEDLGMMLGFEASFGFLFPFKTSNYVLGVDAFFCSNYTKVKSRNENFCPTAAGGAAYIGYSLNIENLCLLLPYLGIYGDQSLSKKANNWDYAPFPKYTTYELIEELGEETRWIRFQNAVGVYIGLKTFVSNNFFIDFHCKLALGGSHWRDWYNIAKIKPYIDKNGERTYQDEGKYLIGDQFNEDLKPLKFVLGIGYQF